MDEEGDGLGVCGWAGFAEDIAIELVKRTKAAFLGAFVAEAFGDVEPFDGFGDGVGFSGYEAGEGGGHFRAEGDGPTTAIFEVKELGDDLVAGFGGEEF